MKKNINDTPIAKPALQFGLIMALALIFLDLAFYLAGNPINTISLWISYAIMLGLLLFSLIKYRDEFNNKKLKYSRALGLGTLIGLFAGLILGIYVFVFYKFIAPELVTELMYNAEEQMLIREPDLSPGDLAIRRKAFEFFFSPIWLGVGSLFRLVFLSFIFSLVVAIFAKRKPAVKV